MKQLIVLLFAVAYFLPANSSAKSITMRADTVALNQAAPDFRLRDMSGKYVTLSSFKGKVVVLDFWATWCVPCHENFPAMQKAVNHYQKDKDVVFLFIDTREKSPDYVNLAKEDMKKNNYNFRVIFDGHGDDGKHNQYYSIMGMWGIPTQFIIDAKGVLKYKNVGYNGSLTDDQRAEELIRQVDQIKSAS